MVTYYKPRPENGTDELIAREHFLKIPVTCYLERTQVLEESFMPEANLYVFEEVLIQLLCSLSKVRIQLLCSFILSSSPPPPLHFRDDFFFESSASFEINVSKIGPTVTKTRNLSSLHVDGNYNRAYGADGILRLFGDEYLTVKWAQTFEPEKDNNFLSLKSSRAFINWERRRFDGFSYRLSMSNVGEDYTPGMGFELRESFTSLEPKIAYGWLPGANSKILQFQTYLKGFWLRNRLSDKVETATGSLGVEFQTKNGWFGNVWIARNREFVPEAFNLSDDVSILSDTYHFWQINGFGSTPFSKLVSTFFNFSIGQFYDGKLFSVGLAPKVKLSKHLDLEGQYFFNFANFEERNKQFIAHVAQFKALYMLNTKFSVASFLQYNSLGKIYAGNIRIRF